MMAVTANSPISHHALALRGASMGLVFVVIARSLGRLPRAGSGHGVHQENGATVGRDEAYPGWVVGNGSGVAGSYDGRPPDHQNGQDADRDREERDGSEDDADVVERREGGDPALGVRRVVAGAAERLDERAERPDAEHEQDHPSDRCLPGSGRRSPHDRDRDEEEEADEADREVADGMTGGLTHGHG